MAPPPNQSLEEINRALSASRRQWVEEMDPVMRRRKAVARWTVRLGIVVQGAVGSAALWGVGDAPAWPLAWLCSACSSWPRALSAAAPCRIKPV